MTNSRKLEEIASNLEDMSVTLEEIKDEAGSEQAGIEKLDQVQAELNKVAEEIEESLEGPQRDR